MTSTQPQTRGRRRKPAAASADYVVVAGQRFKLSDLPLVAFVMTCGHHGRDFAVQTGDLVFCESCRDHSNVARIAAS